MIADEESVQVDDYLNALLAGRFAGPRDLAAGHDIDPELEATAGLVQRALARFHPSFTFEERLAARLDSAAAGRPDADPMDLSAPIIFRPRDIGAAAERQARSAIRRNGAIASGVSIAGVSIAGAAALLVRRRIRLGSPRRVEARF